MLAPVLPGTAVPPSPPPWPSTHSWVVSHQLWEGQRSWDAASRERREQTATLLLRLHALLSLLAAPGCALPAGEVGGLTKAQASTAIGIVKYSAAAAAAQGA